ncbi:hypothetical protein GA0074695_0521 [Micromonospora viridifaciens]|uniref:Choice-of-anchor D domain-containing protein n=1 Tax=Micromonospora viridifaciens TaxID=1881 RepID=A0A1C4UIJ3_MICVI|nr:choice-of-anchor D domain-containing protein [Micromonospora viridifaciens]SCE71477.1 hypothetical protein GA0074695_0521 [Micromonospora viridifaciens]
MRKIRTILGALVAGACASAVLPGVALAAPTAPYTVLTVDVGDAYGKPVKQSGVYDGTNSTVTGRAYATGGVSMGASGLPGGATIAMWITPPVGQSAFTAGQTYPTRGSADATRAGLNISSAPDGCNGADAYGSLTVREVAYDDAGAATAFAAAYEFHCSSNAGAVTGELRWNSSLDYVGVTAFPVPVLDFGRVAIGGTMDTRAVILTVKGTAPSTFDAAGISGANRSSFEVVTNECSGKTIAPGGSCRFLVRPKALRWGDYTANLEVADNSSYGKRVVPMKFTAYDTVIGMYYPLPPQRLLDTRTGQGPLGANSATELQVTGRGGVPASGVGSVVLNVTVTGPTADSFLTLFPSTESVPTASSINFPAGWLGSNNVTVKVGPDGKVMIYNRNGSTHVVVDVVGFYANSDTVKSSLGWGGQYQRVEPTRLIDTRPNTLAAGQTISSYVDFGPASPHVKALVLNITAVKPVKAGFLSAWSGETAVPTSSTVNYGAGKVVPNLAFVQTGRCTNCNGLPYAVPTFSIYTSQVTDLVVDLLGVIDDGSLPDGLRFTPLSPTRIADSRSGLGTFGALEAGEIRKITPPSTVATSDTRVLAMNVTAVSPTKDTVLTVWPADAGMARPGVSNLNPAAGQIVSNAVMGGLGPQYAFNVHNHTGSVHLVADVVGRFYLYSGTASTTALAGRQPLAVRGTGTPG